MRRMAAHIRPRRQGIQVDSGNRVDGVDRREAIRAAHALLARAMVRMSEMFGVSFTSTGVRATSFTHSVIIRAYSGTCPTAEPIPRSLIP